MKRRLIKIDPRDNVAVALDNIASGEIVDIEGEQVLIPNGVKAKHKVALTNLAAYEEITMYGVLVGKATQHIAKGEVISTQNLAHDSSKTTGRTAQFHWQAPDVEKWSHRSFLGYHRPDGQVGTDNVWIFFPLVFCENRNIEILKDAFENELLSASTSKYRLQLRGLVSGNPYYMDHSQGADKLNVLTNVKIKFITHQGGCGGIRQDAQALARLFAGYVNNPNVAGATVLSLGCQNLQVEMFRQELARINPSFAKPLLVYEQQKMGTVDTMLSTIIRDSYTAILKANGQERQPAPLNKLVVGLECGGSDGFSGISANPTLGYVSDVLAALRAGVILAEFPELVGVEQELVNRCVNDESATKFLRLMAEYEESVIHAGSGFHMNPSPGNIKDGLITDAMKSAGAAKKGGSSPVEAVLDYGDYLQAPGLNLLCTPGNDVESTTAIVGSGANMVLFTTGLGTPTGNPVAPVIKVSSNTELAQRMPDIIDISTGPVITGEKSLAEMGDELLELMIEVASGLRRTKAEELNQSDFIPWRRGVSL